MTQSIQGILPALVTPFAADGSLAVPALEQLLERLYGCGSGGVYVCGNTGEGLLMDPAVREKATEITVRNSPPGSQVVVHVGAAIVTDAIRLARHAERAGALAISSLPPAGGYPFEEIHAYYRDLAAAVNIPVLVYYFPDMAPSIRSLEQILSLCEIPGVVGMKFTDFDLYRLGEIRREGHIVMNGRDEVLAAGLYMGAQGGIGTFYNLIPRTFVEIHRTAQAGDWTAARHLQDGVNRLIRLTLRYPALAAVKRMLEWSGIAAGPCLPPRLGLTPEQWESLQAELLAAGFTPEGFQQGIVG
ncbi:MAG: dihydrodipicolinate synthase family protein [Bryobacterales bacterium]|nr:dihydrodipicolinate synthase family protein [Bryobacterales bacterium]